MTNKKNPWLWVPSLYFAEGLPYIMVMVVSVIMYKRLGISNTDIALYTSWFYLPWIIKPLWSPIVDILKTKRLWIVVTQFVTGVGFAGAALTIPTSHFFQYTLAFFWLIAFSSATHDISADGFYMLGLTQKEQSFFVGIRSTFYRIAMITGQGLLVIIAGLFEEHFGSVKTAWQITFAVASILFLGLFLYHKFILPYPKSDKPTLKRNRNFWQEFIITFVTFFKRKNIFPILLFILFYRFGEGQLAKIAAPFMLDAKNIGGLALSTVDVGFLYGTVGIIALVIGGILGGIAASRNGLKYWIWWMLIAINLPDVVYVYLSYLQPESLFTIGSLIAVEQFGYGFGFTAFMLYLIYVSDGEHKTAHYAIATGIMALGMMLPGMLSGWLQETIGYQLFFVWVLIATIPSFVIVKYIPLDADFGKK